ncbi:MAG: isochorismatase family cysteine hydrolase [Candidatus Competibacteraceae bacterium]|nr:isochorismatase family cysteine hydrolase [Candidatus Competibacteraceae bacterium]
MADTPLKPALLLIDFINDLAFEQGPRLLEHARPAARCAQRLKGCFKGAGLPIIYVNDNFGYWRSNFPEVVKHCSQEQCPGRELVEMLYPQEDDYFVLKPLHSGFYSTTLEVLLDHLAVNTLVLTGLSTDVCVLFTANDAYMRNFRLFVPRDCVAAVDSNDHHYVLKYMERVLKVDTREWQALRELIDL